VIRFPQIIYTQWTGKGWSVNLSTIIDLQYSYGMKGGIYLIRCLVDGRVYVGSSNNFHKRWLKHKSELNNKCHGSRLLEDAWHKYGSNQFIWMVLEYVRDEEELWSVEKNYIRLYRADDLRFGFNSINSIGRHSRETIERMRKAHIGVPLSQIHRQKMSEAQLRRYRECETESEEVRINRSKAHIGKIRTEESRKKQSETRRRKNIRPTVETRNKMSASHKILERTQEHCQNISKGKKGQKFTPKAIENMREAQCRRRLREKQEKRGVS
jgi:group I intron endonuclease